MAKLTPSFSPPSSSGSSSSNRRLSPEGKLEKLLAVGEREMVMEVEGVKEGEREGDTEEV